MNIFLLFLHGSPRRTGLVRGMEETNKNSIREFDESMILRNNGLWEAGIQGRFGNSQEELGWSL